MYLGFSFYRVGGSWGLSLPYYRVILGIYRGYIAIMEKKMEAIIVFRVKSWGLSK